MNVNGIRENLINYCRELKCLEERPRVKYNSFYLNGTNVGERRKASKSFIIQLKENQLIEESRKQLEYNPKVKGNNQVLKVNNQYDFKIAKTIIKSLIQFNY